MEHSLDDLGVAKLEELAAHLSELQDSPAGTLATTPSTSGDMANKVSGFRADESYSAVQHWIPRKYGKVDDSVVFSSYRSNKLSAVSSTDFLNMPNFSHKPQAYSSRFRQRDEYNNAPENSFDREPDHSHNYKSVSPPFYANGDEHSYERSVSKGRRQGNSFQTCYKSRSRSPGFSKDHRRRRSSSNSSSDSSTKTFETSAFRYRSRSPRIFKDRRRRRKSSESSSGSSTTLSPSRITASKAPQIDEDLVSLLKRVDEVQKRSKILQAQADKTTRAMPHTYPGFQNKNSRGLLAACPEIRPPKLIASAPPPVSSYVYAGFGSSLSCSPDYPMMAAMTASKPTPVGSAVAQEANSKTHMKCVEGVSLEVTASSCSTVEHAIDRPSSGSPLTSILHQTPTISHAIMPKLVQVKTYLSTSAIPSVYPAIQNENFHVFQAACSEVIPTKFILPVAPPPTLSKAGHAYAGFGRSSLCSSTHPAMTDTASSELVSVTSSVAPDPENLTLREPASSSLALKETVIKPTAVSPLPHRYIRSLPIVTKSSNPNLITIQPTPAANKQIDKFIAVSNVRMIGSLEEIIKKFKPKTIDATFNYVGFFMECFRGTNQFDRGSDLQEPVMLLNMVSTKNSILVREPACDTVSKIWCCSIAIDGNYVKGYGLVKNSAILNALGLAFPEKVSDLRYFARHQGFLGWKFARKQYSRVCRDQKYDAVKVKLWAELNQTFFLKSSKTEYCREDTGEKGQIVYEKLKEVAGAVFGNTDLMTNEGPVCFDVRAMFKSGNDEELLTGTHFSLGSACLTLISSMFDVLLQMKFFDDLLLLLGAGSLKRTDNNQVVTDFYSDLIFARSDFVAVLCGTCDNVDPAVVASLGLSAGEECIVVLQCLVADDAFYYNLLGWIFGQRLTTDSYETKQFFKMWSVSGIRFDRSINLCQKNEKMLKLEKSWFTDLTLRNFTDYRIFASKVCQSSYAWRMVDYLLSRQIIDNEMFSTLRNYANLMQDNIAIHPYSPLCAHVLLGKDDRPLVYENSSSITGLVLTQERSEKRAAFIRSMCRHEKGSELAEIICKCVDPRQFEAVFDVASRDVLYISAIEQPIDFTAMGWKLWHRYFWQSLGEEALEMPDLRYQPALLRLN